MQGSVHKHISKPLTGIQMENFCLMQPFSVIFEKAQESGKVPSDSGEKGILHPFLKKGINGGLWELPTSQPHLHAQ